MKKLAMEVMAAFVMTSLGACGSLLGSPQKKAAPAKIYVSDLAEVPDNPGEPRMNPLGNARAGTDVYANWPGKPVTEGGTENPPPVWAISGIKGQEIRVRNPNESVDIYVDVGTTDKDSVAERIREYTDLTSWFGGTLPAGLVARAHETRKGDTVIKIYISGTPEASGRANLKVTVPAQYLTSGSSRTYTSATESENLKSWDEALNGPRK